MKRVKGSTLDVGMFVCIAGIHYYEVISAAKDPNGLKLHAVPDASSSMQQLLNGFPDTEYHVVELEEVAAAKQRKMGYRTVVGQANTMNLRQGPEDSETEIPQVPETPNPPVGNPQQGSALSALAAAGKLTK